MSESLRWGQREPSDLPHHISKNSLYNHVDEPHRDQYGNQSVSKVHKLLDLKNNN